MASKFNTRVSGATNVILGDNATITITKGVTNSKKGKDKTDIQHGNRGCVQETDQSNTECKKIEFTFNSFEYKIKKGYALIINNTNYPSRSHEPIRNGSEQDVKAVRDFFETAGFHPIRVENDVKQDKLFEILDEVSEKDFRRYDAFACVILSHGGENGIACVDEKFVPLQIIISKFQTEYCPSLTGKPKIFFVQACRGESISQSGSLSTDATMTDAPLPRMPSDADFLMVNSCAPGFKSMRHVELGSWFINQLVKILKEYAHEEHLMDMILRLNYVLAEMESEDGKKQISSQFSTLSKKVYFTVPRP